MQQQSVIYAMATKVFWMLQLYCFDLNFLFIDEGLICDANNKGLML